MAFDHPSGGKYIAAYIVSDKSLDTSAVANFIRERKPPYMVPAVIMQIERIPLNQNQKVNHRALPVPEFKAGQTEPDNNRPLNALEQELHDMAAKVTGVETFGISTPFSDIGLTSILSIKLSSRLYKRFGEEIPSKALLNGGSVETIENILLARWMNPGHQEKTAPEPSIEEKKATPLSFPQTGVYFECMKRPADVVYNIPAMIRFDRSVSGDRLQEAVVAIVKAHQVLCTKFENTENGVIQLHNGDTEVDVERRHLSPQEFDAFKREFVRPFRLSSGPLYRLAVVECENDIYLFTDFHHLVFDGTSFDIFLNQLRDALRGISPAAETYTYSAYVADEKGFENSALFEENRRFYAGMLEEMESASEISADLKGKEAEGKLTSVHSPFDMTQVEQYARNHATTPAAIMLAAVFYTISRYINDTNVYLSTISSGRSDVRTSDTFGMFVNTLPLGIKIGEETSAEFIGKSAAVFQGVIEHEKYPFAKIAADFGFKPQIVYEYQLGVITGNDFPEMKGIDPLEMNSAKFKLSIHIETVDGKPSVVVFYNDALYSRALMEGLARSIVIAVGKMLSEPEGKIKKVDFIDKEREKELNEFHTVATAAPKFGYFHEGLEHQAFVQPDKKALVACDGEFSYSELDAYANRIADSLIKRGVKEQSRVALMLPRTSRMIMAMFGVMKAGSAYIPCDPEYPVERIQHILNDSHAAYIITTADRVPDFPNAIDVETLLDGAATKPEIHITPKDLAYLIYTSGSTGKPKGVMLRHESIANYLTDHPANSHIHALAATAKTLLSITTVSFDMSLKEIGAALFNGLTLVFADEDHTTNPIHLAALFEKTEADAFNTTPSRMLQFMELPAFVKALSRHLTKRKKIRKRQSNFQVSLLIRI